MAESLGMTANQGSSNELITEKRLLSLSTIFALFAFIIASCILLGPILMSSKDGERQKSIVQAQSLAYQVAILDDKRGSEELKERALADQDNAQSSSREPASAAEKESSGTIGNDPWGQAYHYKIRHEGRHKIVDVWSLGENAIQTQVLIPADAL